MEDYKVLNRAGITYPGTLLRMDSRGRNVALMQQYLNSIAKRYTSIPKIKEDGIFGPRTQNAVLAFQREFGLTPDGIIGPITWNKIVEIYNTSEETGHTGRLLTIGSQGNNVRLMQEYLNSIAAKYSAIPTIVEDGIFGPRTQNAVIAFQRQFGLSPDGIIGPITWNKIIEVANEIPGAGDDQAGNGTGTGTGNGTGTGVGTGTGNGTGTNANGLTADELETFNLINQQRTNNGLQPLVIDPEVQNVARIKAQDMVDNNYFSHTSPTYGSPFQMLDSFGVQYTTAGENIAGNSSNSAAVTAWMNSSGHKANILNENFTHTGIGVVNDPRYGKIYVQMFIGK